jgi:hypothetical protein
MLAAETQLLAERDESGDDEHELDDGVPRALVRHPTGNEGREADGDGGQREQQPLPAREVERQIVEDVPELAGNGRLDGRCLPGVGGCSGQRE